MGGWIGETINPRINPPINRSTNSLTHGFLQLDPPITKLANVRLRRHALVRSPHAWRADFGARLHLPRDRERVAGRPHHRADAVGLVETVDEIEPPLRGLATLRAAHRDA